ncbi:MAG: hypothetical protein NTY20_00665 [Candidatus Aenigmarchaeota archaeon]|nr:hypothetical protein [Candidatus Aenigmarchaeota archaeon]
MLAFPVLISQDAGASSYIANDTMHNLTFSNLTAMQQSLSSIQNLTYQINVTNYGNATAGEQYNLSVVNCSNLNQPGVGFLNTYFLNLSQNQSITAQLYVSNSTAGMYSSCIMANHWNGSVMETSWNLTSSNDSVILNSSFYPDLSTSAVHWTSVRGNITVHNATIVNSGDFNFSGNISVYLLWDGVVVNNTVTVVNTSLANGTPYNVSFGNITNATNGLHNLTVWVDALNNVTESNETNNNYTVQVFVSGYIITILNVTGQNGTNTAANRNVIMNVSVKYENGINVTNLNRDNFTVYDVYGGSIIDAWDYADTVFNSSFNSSMSSSGIYWFTINSSTPINDTDTRPGTHNITVQVSNSESNNTYLGNSSGNDYYYLIVPNLHVALSGSSTVTEGNTRAISVNVSNTGTDSIYNVIITAIDDSDYSEVPSNPSGCTKTVLTNASDYLTCSFSATTSAVSDNQVVTIYVTASGTHNYSGSANVTYTKTEPFTLTIVNEGTTQTTDGGGGTTTKSCTTDAQCSANESCSATKKCAAISCTNGEILDHVCIQFVYKINITAYDSLITALSGEGNSTKVTVKNTGPKTFSAKLEVTINNVTASVTPLSYSLGAGESYQFTVNFTVPNTTTIGNFSGTFKAYVTTSTSTYDSKAFTFTVLPKEETKTVINISYQEFLAIFSSLVNNLTQMKTSGVYNQTVLSSIESLISAVNSTLLQMKNAMESNDYVSAQSLISQVNTSINSVKAQMEGAQIEVITSLPAQYGIWFWAAVAVIIIFVVGFFIYMFYPSSHVGYHPEKGYAHPEAREGLGARIKKLFRRKKKEVPPASISTFTQSMAEPSKEGSDYDTFHYGEGYKKEKSYGYQYSREGGAKGFFQKFRRKKNKKSPQMHLDQFGNQAVTEQKSE